MRRTRSRAALLLAAALPGSAALLAAAALPGCAVGGPLPPPATQPALPADDGLYYLPFPAGFTTIVAQGNFGIAGQGSHVRKYALDFVMPVGTAVVAARPGVVVAVRDDCPNVNCPFDEERCCGNFIRIRHADGTVAGYWHLVQDGACVSRGQEVARGDVLGRSGNTGVSLGPHLHFTVAAAEGQAGGGSLGPSRDGSLEVAFEDVGGSGVPALLSTVQSRNAAGRDFCGGE